MNYTYALFDLDGTILDTNELILSSFEHALNIHAPGQYAREDILPHMGRALVDQMEFFAPGRGSEVIPTYRKFNIEKHDELVVEFPHSQAVLRQLKEAGVKIGIVTSKIRLTAEMGLKLTGMHDLVDAIITIEDVEKHKPDPEPVQRALALLGGTPSQAIMVGDSPYDIQAGQAAGTATVGVKWSLRGEAGLAPFGPDHLIGDMRELLTIILGDEA
ncbi:MAG: pyrophosphatase PpaX [Tumebacillaceae bacterium]